MADSFTNLIKQILTSKKALASIAGMLMTLAAKYGFQLDETTITQLVSIVISYVVGQGIADLGKNTVVTFPTERNQWTPPQ